MNLWNILQPIEVLIGWILYLFHELFSVLGLGRGAGVSWVLAIVFLTLFVRLCILPLFIRQIHGIRKTQSLQPQLMAIQKKYKNKKDSASRQQMSQETMELYRKNGANPMGSCLPMLLQLPIFFSLYNVLRTMNDVITGARSPIGPIDIPNATDFQNSQFFGVKLFETFSSMNDLSDRILIGALIVIMIGLTFVTQRISIFKNMPQTTLEGPQAGMQKAMIYILPFTYIFIGPMLPIGVLIYWVTTNTWTLGQTLWQVHYMPTPGSKAFEKFEERKREKKQKEFENSDDGDKSQSHSGGQRVQPKKKSRNRR
ncbi:MAG: membrane protein insertase YidC [Bifidobacteriaceae bacterium]|jgi:YidC/Oxa1 family membrane protein insertase|nr:membrane protein insertase YidC [Bifidobacteriaceae bacterium]